MITTFLLNIVYYTVKLLIYPLRFLPDATLPSQLDTGITKAGEWLGALENFVDVRTLMIMIGVILSFEVALVTFKLISWVLKKIPTIS